MTCCCSKILKNSKLRKGILIGFLYFLVIGTVTALWENPIFPRMAEVTALDYISIISLSVLIAVFFAVKRDVCSTKTAGFAGFLGLFGIMCPICNPLLALFLTSEVIIAYFAPFRLYVALFGVAIMAYLVYRELKLQDMLTCKTKTD